MTNNNQTNIFHSALTATDQFQDESFVLPDLDLNYDPAFIQTSPTTSTAPYKLTPCRQPICRPKGAAQSATSFKKKVTPIKELNSRSHIKLVQK